MANYVNDSFGERNSGTPCRNTIFRYRTQNTSCICKKKELRPPTTLGEAVILIAKIGGYLNRNNDLPPGHQIIWHGYAKLKSMSSGFALSEYWHC
jgi:hypothetical protein